MTKVFVDANIIITVLNREYPHFRMTGRLLSLADDRFTIYTSATCLAIAFYFACKKCSEKKALEKIITLCEKLQVTNAGDKEVKAALSNKKVLDFEDGIEYYSALHAGCDYIVTEDESDFQFAELPVMNCETFLREVVLAKTNRPYSKPVKLTKK
jgi:predicted nucleic acid-binding protein